MASCSAEKDDLIYLRPETINEDVTISTYYKERDFPKLMSTLKSIGGENLLTTFRGTCFGHFADWCPRMKSNRALHHVLSRQIPSPNEEMWFQLCGERVCFSTTYFALITGLHFGGSSFNTTELHDCRSVQVYRQFCGGRSMNVHQLITHICDLSHRVNDPDGGLYLRAVLVCVAHTYILGSDMLVESWLWALVDDLEAFNKFPWGAYSYKVLRHYNTNVGKGSKYHFYGPSWALLVWSFERVPGCGEIAAARNSEYPVYPRFRRWSFKSKTNADQLQALFENQDGVWSLVADSYELATSYWLSAASPCCLDVAYTPSYNPLSDGLRPPNCKGRATTPVNESDFDTGARRTTRTPSVRQSQESASSEVPVTRSWLKTFFRKELRKSEARMKITMQTLLNEVYQKVKGTKSKGKDSSKRDSKRRGREGDQDDPYEREFDNAGFRHEETFANGSSIQIIEAPRHSMPECTHGGSSWIDEKMPHPGFLRHHHGIPLLSYRDCTDANVEAVYTNSGNIAGHPPQRT